MSTSGVPGEMNGTIFFFFFFFILLLLSPSSFPSATFDGGDAAESAMEDIVYLLEGAVLATSFRVSTYM